MNIRNRRSIRKFSDKRISLDILNKLCKTAEQAPSARNQKSREYIIINDKEILNQLKEIATGTKIIENTNHVIAVVGKPLDELSTPMMASLDLAMASENLMLDALNYNIGSTFMGIYPLEDRMNKANEILNLAKGYYTFGLISLGYPNDLNEFNDKAKAAEIKVI